MGSPSISSAAPAATTSTASDNGPTQAAKNAAIAVPIVFIGTLAIALAIFFYMIRQQRRREDEEQQTSNQFRNSSPTPILEKKEPIYNGPSKPRNSSSIDPHTKVVRRNSSQVDPHSVNQQRRSSQIDPHSVNPKRKSSQIDPRAPATPASNNHTSPTGMSGKSNASRGASPYVVPGRLNSEPFARDQGPLVKNAIRDSGLISPGTSPGVDLWPARSHVDNFSIPSEKSDEEDEEAFGKLGSLHRLSYTESERDVEYGAGQSATVAHIERPAPVVATSNLGTNDYSPPSYYNDQGGYSNGGGSKKMRTL